MPDITEFIKGQRDCEEGNPQKSQHPDYVRGYGAQYALEESKAWFTEKQMEKANA